MYALRKAYYRQRHRDRYRPVELCCRSCGKLFFGHGLRRYCSDFCKRKAANRLSVERRRRRSLNSKPCRQCGSAFIGRGLICSDRCRKIRSILAKREWDKLNPEARRKHRRHRGKSTVRRRKWLLQIQNGKCAICSLKLGKVTHIDHIMPRALGGSNARSNLQLVHPACNLRKGYRHPIRHAQTLGKLL